MSQQDEKIQLKKTISPMLLALSLSIILNAALALMLGVMGSRAVVESKNAEQWKSKASREYAEAFLKKYSENGKVLLPKGTTLGCNPEKIAGEDRVVYKCDDFSILPPSDY